MRAEVFCKTTEGVVEGNGGWGVCIMVLISCSIGLLLGLMLIKLTDSKPDRYDEGFLAGIAAQQFTDKAVEEAAMKWWSGSPDLIGARERLCKNYYPPKGKK